MQAIDPITFLYASFGVTLFAGAASEHEVQEKEDNVILLQRYVSNLDDASTVLEGNDQPSIRLSIPSAKRPGFVSQVHCRIDERCAFVQMRGWWLYVATPVGLECYPELSALLANAPTLGRQATLKRLEDLRLLSFVVFCERSDEVSFGRSLDGFASFFFSGQSTSLTVSDSRLEIARQLGPIKLSEADREEWCEHGYLSPEGSFFEGVCRCFAGVRYCSELHETGGPERKLMAPEARILDRAGSNELLHEGLLATFSGYGNRRIALRLSGGVDSRVLLAGLLGAVRQGILHKDQILCISVLFPGLECDESEEIREITRIAGIELAGIVATTENVEQSYAQCLQLPAPPFPTSFMGALCMTEARKRGVQIMLSGHGGDEIFDFDLVDVLGFPLFERLRRFQLIRRLRSASAFSGNLKAVASTLVGRRTLRSTLKLLLAHGLAADAVRAHRLGRRISLAQGTGYEMSARNSASEDLLIDIPFLRGSYFNHFDPASQAPADGGDYKVVACDYMEAHAAQLTVVRARKAVFDAVVKHLFPPKSRKCDQLDQKSTLSYASTCAYLGWRTRYLPPEN